MTKLRQRMMEELRLRNSSEETIRSYIESLKRFARYYDKSPDQMNAEQVRCNLLYLLEERRLTRLRTPILSVMTENTIPSRGTYDRGGQDTDSRETTKLFVLHGQVSHKKGSGKADTREERRTEDLPPSDAVGHIGKPELNHEPTRGHDPS